MQSLADNGAIDPAGVDEIVAALIKREQNGSTGFGKGVAVPHAKHPKVTKMIGTIGRSSEGLDFAALDHQPVYCIVLLLSPEGSAQQHLQSAANTLAGASGQNMNGQQQNGEPATKAADEARQLA